VEAALGTGLPTDFKEFTELYGTVKICNYLCVHTPFPVRPEYAAFLRSLSAEYDAVAGGRDHVPYPDFPAPGGLLGITGTDSGDVLSWITAGGPDEWGVFFWHWPGLDVYPYPRTTLTGFLVRTLRQDPALFPHALPETFFSPDSRGLVVTD
jgi:hypothetical protein